SLHHLFFKAVTTRTFKNQAFRHVKPFILFFLVINIKGHDLEIIFSIT
ncbi:hypothetical protein X975_22631, partial [Stegodyphus mimosarum]